MTDINDEVYFKHPSGPLSGVIRTQGQHGAQIECGGVVHRVKWGDLLGHKRRTRYAARVIDQGEDGAIMQREDGRTFYLEGAIPSAPPDPQPTRSPRRSLGLSRLLEEVRS